MHFKKHGNNKKLIKKIENIKKSKMHFLSMNVTKNKE